MFMELKLCHHVGELHASKCMSNADMQACAAAAAGHSPYILDPFLAVCVNCALADCCWHFDHAQTNFHRQDPASAGKTFSHCNKEQLPVTGAVQAHCVTQLHERLHVSDAGEVLGTCLGLVGVILLTRANKTDQQV